MWAGRRMRKPVEAAKCDSKRLNPVRLDLKHQVGKFI